MIVGVKHIPLISFSICYHPIKSMLIMLHKIRKTEQREKKSEKIYEK